MSDSIIQSIPTSDPGRPSANRHIKGFSLLEVLISIVIFAFGLLALVQLQGSLSRSAADANQRTVAVNLAEETMEQRRGFSRLTTDPNGSVPAYADIVGGTQYRTRGGIVYRVDSVVRDYYYSGESVTTSAPTGRPNSDFKVVDLTVSWDSGQEFRVDSNTQASLGSGSVRLTDVIASTTSAASARGLATGNLNAAGPEVQYDPGSQPDVISITLGNNRFKESTVPLPDVIRQNERVETTFDVVTYSQFDEAASFIRREEFRAISCACTLRVPTSTSQGGNRPTAWTGKQYKAGEFVSKPYGVSASNQQSIFCDVCCRDHHDGGTGVDDDPNDPGRSRYDPFKDNDPVNGNDEYWGASSTLVGDHKHYNRDAEGNLILAQEDMATYLEACRLVRKDGFFKTAQDLRAESLNNFPASYLNTDSGVANYSSFVTRGVSEYDEAVGSRNLYEDDPPVFPEPSEVDPPVNFPATSPSNPAYLPTPTGATNRQLQTRGIYLDYLSDELRVAINCLDMGGTGETCDVPGVVTALEIIPFYDVQLTWLARWTEEPNNNPVDVSNQAVQTDNAHSRGLAVLSSGFGPSTVNAAAHKGNLGLTATDPVDPLYGGRVKQRNMHLHALNSTPPPAMTDFLVSGEIISAVPGVKAANVEISATGAQCDRTNTGFECAIESGATSPRLTVTNYPKVNRIVLACSSQLTVHGSETGSNPWTRFNLPLQSTSGAHIVIKENACN